MIRSALEGGERKAEGAGKEKINHAQGNQKGLFKRRARNCSKGSVRQDRRISSATARKARRSAPKVRRVLSAPKSSQVAFSSPAAVRRMSRRRRIGSGDIAGDVVEKAKG